MQRSERGILQILLSPKTRTQRVASIVAALAAGGLSIALIKKLLKSSKRQKKERQGEKKIPKKLDAEFWRQLKNLLDITIPNLKSPESFNMIAIVLVQICITVITNRQSEVSGELLRGLLDRNPTLFKNQLITNVILSAVISVIQPLLSYLKSTLSLRFRRRLTSKIHDLYYSDMTYYKTNFLDKRISNPDQLVTRDVELYSDKACDMFMKIIHPLIDVVYFTYKLIQSGGISGPTTVVFYMGIAITVIQMVAPNFGNLMGERQRLEGNFRKAHTRIRQHGESIAIYNGDEFEKKIAEKRFEEFVKHERIIHKKQYSFGIIYDAIFKYFPHTVVWIILGLPIYLGNYSHLSLGELISEVKYISAMIGSEFQAVGNLFSLYRNLLEFSGYTTRVASFIDVMKEIKEKDKQSNFEGKYMKGDTIRFENVSIINPKNEVLGTGLTFEVGIKQNTIITGPNGAGKSSLFRVLGGLWPLHKGTIYKPGGDESSGLHAEIFYVPQKPYNCNTLRDQIMYPTPDDGKIPDEHFADILKMVNLSKLTLEYGFKKVHNWSLLSIGEQQKLAMARLFFHKPKFAILDECTSGITLDDEKFLYDKCEELGITCITISHRPALNKYHSAEIKFDGKGNVIYRQKTKEEMLESATESGDE